MWRWTTILRCSSPILNLLLLLLLLIPRTTLTTLHYGPPLRLIRNRDSPNPIYPRAAACCIDPQTHVRYHRSILCSFQAVPDIVLQSHGSVEGVRGAADTDHCRLLEIGRRDAVVSVCLEVVEIEGVGRYGGGWWLVRRGAGLPRRMIRRDWNITEGASI